MTVCSIPASETRERPSSEAPVAPLWGAFEAFRVTGTRDIAAALPLQAPGDNGGSLLNCLFLLPDAEKPYIYAHGPPEGIGGPRRPRWARTRWTFLPACRRKVNFGAPRNCSRWTFPPACGGKVRFSAPRNSPEMPAMDCFPCLSRKVRSELPGNVSD